MKVLMIVHNPPYQGGIVQYSILLANALKLPRISLLGFKNLYPPFLYKGKLPKKNQSGIQFNQSCQNILAWYNPLTWLKAAWLARKQDIIHIHWVSPLLTPLYYIILKTNAIFFRKKVLMTCHNIEPHESTFLDRFFISLVFPLIDHFVVHAPENKRRLMRKYHVRAQHISVIEHGNFDFFRQWSTQSKEELRKHFNIQGTCILFFGYIRPYKGLRFLLEALSRVLQQEQATLIIAGELWESWKEYQAIISKHYLTPHLRIFPHYINDRNVHQYFMAADLVVLPYHNTEQTISGPLLASFSFAKPTIVAAAGGIKEFAEGKAVIIEGGNPEKLAESILHLIHNPQHQQQLSTAASACAQELTWDNVAARYMQAYQRMLKSPKRK